MSITREMEYVELTKYPNAKSLAGHLRFELEGIVMSLISDHHSENEASQMVLGQLQDTLGILDGIARGTIHSGVRRSVGNVISALEGLDQKEHAQECVQLRNLLPEMSHYGISIEGYNLESRRKLNSPVNR